MQNNTRKNYFIWVIRVNLLLLLCLLGTSKTVYADVLTENKYKEEWELEKEYPVKPEDDEWATLTFVEQLEVCSMPEEMLTNTSTEELVKYVLEYPFLPDLLLFDSPEKGIDYLVRTSNICEEFFKRDEATALLLEAYGEYAEVKSATYAASENHEADIAGHFKEIFLQAYFVENFDEMSESEKKILEDIVYDRLCAYNAGDEYVSLNIVKWLGEKYRVNDTATLSNYTATGDYVTFLYSDTLWATYEKTVYEKYGTTGNCLKYITSNFTDADIVDYNETIDNLHPSWIRTFSSTPKYNCHSYAWLIQASYNTYWLNNPDPYAETFTYVNRNGSAVNGDKIIIRDAEIFEDIFGEEIDAAHSVIVVSNGSNSGAIRTESKLGASGVYETTLLDMMVLYGGNSYEVYR